MHVHLPVVKGQSYPCRRNMVAMGLKDHYDLMDYSVVLDFLACTVGK